MTSIQFDEHGYLVPYQEIDVNLEIIETHFVEQFQGSRTRHGLFTNFQWYLETFKAEIFPHFEQWLNGSFVTQKLNPADIDFVTFLNFRVFQAKEGLLDNFLSFSLETKGLDAYIVPVFPVDHENHQTSKAFQNQWLNRFTTTKADDLDRIYQKGFLKLTF